ncbi:hypothetical protein [Desulfonatronospira sp.]|uniref:hypothetical protein n=1 Tax=Desulfonatronospira sp. TaxID=1962951 RepID=UPI0025C24C96|nr:hypothetical protein [Desulfonatronospira sp.]
MYSSLMVLEKVAPIPGLGVQDIITKSCFFAVLEKFFGTLLATGFDFVIYKTDFNLQYQFSKNTVQAVGNSLNKAS